MDNVNVKANIAKKDDDIREELINEYMPFILSSVSKCTKSYVDRSDDEFQIGLIAFNEAIDAYEEDKGNFLSFANGIISRRLIDYYRQHKKHENMVLDDEKLQRVETKQPRIDLKYEIEKLQKRLNEFNITFYDLADNGPKHKATKRYLLNVVSFLIKDTKAKYILNNKGYLPVKYLKKAGFNKKKIERGRKYIIAVLIIQTEGYDAISEYLDLMEE